MANANQKSEPFIITRTFNADIETLFTMWTDPKHMSQWLSPQGSSVKYVKADIKPGGMLLEPAHSKKVNPWQFLLIAS